MKNPPERGLSIVRRRRQQFSFIRLPAYLRTRESFMIKIKPRRSEVYLSCDGAGNDSVLADYRLICVRVSFYDKNKTPPGKFIYRAAPATTQF